MKKYFCLSVMAFIAILWTSCTNDDSNTLGVPDNSDRVAVGFKSFVEKNTKGTSTPSGQLAQNFWVYAYYDSIGDRSSVTLKPDFMSNQLVSYSSSGFSYTPAQYWPETGDVNFYAFTPNTSSHLTMTKPVLGDSIGYPTFTYIMDNTIASQEDLLVAQAEDQDGMSGNVNFNFDHALTKIVFCARTAGDYQAMGATVKITGITFTNIVNSKSFSFDRYTNSADSTWWQPIASPTTTSYSPNISSGGIVPYFVRDTFMVITPSSESILAIPQSFTGTPAQIQLTYTISYSTGLPTRSFTKIIPLDGTISWKPGYCINYALSIDLSLVTFTATVNDWNEVFQNISIIPEDDNE